MKTDELTVIDLNGHSGYAEGHQVLFRISYADSDMQSYVYTYVGLIALNGMNSSPLGLCCNTFNTLFGGV